MTDLSTNDARLALVGKWAAKYGLNSYLVCAVIEQESGWNPYVWRFEPGFLRTYVKPANPDSPTTRELGLSCSFGLMQVMGLVAVELGWQGDILRLTDPDNAVDFGCRKLQKCFAVHVEPETSLLAYNGGGNLLYGEQVLARVAHYMPQAEGAD